MQKQNIGEYSSVFQGTGSSMETTMKMRDLLESLEEITKCAVCLEGVGCDVVQCMTGHGICGRCRRQILMCPTCGEFFLASRPTMLAQILETLPKLCKFSEQGCKDISFSSNHELFCEFRPFQCKLGKFRECQWSGMVKDFKAHVQSFHNSFFSSYAAGVAKKLTFKHFKDHWHTQYYLHIVEDNLFLLFAHKDQVNKRFVLLVKQVPIGPPKSTFYFTVTFSRQKVVFKHSIKACAINNEKERLEKSPFCMITPMEEMESFVNLNTGNLEATFEAVKNEV